MRLLPFLIAVSLSTGAIAQPKFPLSSSAPERKALDLSKLMFPYIYFERDKVLLEGIDFDATLRIAELELEDGGFDSILTIWTIRDQIISPAIAQRIGELYLRYIDSPQVQGSNRNFTVWHFAWAIGNIYRLGGEEVKAAIEKAYQDALKRPQKIDPPYDGILKNHLTGDRIYMGDAHAGGRAYARSHIVIPGNPRYLQSFDDYAAKLRH